MHLYIFDDTVTTDVSGITLRDGCLPSVADYIHNPSDFSLEPAVWFKVQVLDVISVDCSRRLLSWEISGQEDDGPESANEEGTDRKSDPNLLISVCAEEFLALDEVFDGLPVLVSNYHGNGITKAQFYEGIVKLLHLYILPNVYLSSAHISTLRNALEKQVSFVETINVQIDRLSQKSDSVNQAKRKLRQKFVLEITANEDLVYSGSLMTSLASDIDDDIREMSGTLEVAQDEVNRKKKTGDGSSSSSSSMDQAEVEQLADARKSRNDVMHSYVVLLNARENILHRKSLLENFRKRRKVQDFIKVRDQPEQRIYSELTLVQEELISKMRSLADKKVMAASVRESMRRTLDDLERGNDSFGTETDSGGIVGDSDDLDKSLTPSKSWMTLADHVTHILQQPNHAVTAMHVTFCACVVARCRAAFNERILYETNFGNTNDELASSTELSNLERSCSEQLCSASMDCSPDACTVVVPSEFGESVSLPPASFDRSDRKSTRGFFKKTRRKRDTKVAKPSKSLPTPSTHGPTSTSSSPATLCLLDSAGDDAVLIYDEKTDYAKRAIDSLKRDIAEHFETVTEQLRTELKQKSKTSIWLSYESLFYNETMEHILTLYGLEYSAVTRMLGQSIRQLRVADLKFQDSILVNMLEDESETNCECLYDRNGEPEEHFNGLGELPETRDSSGTGSSSEIDLLEKLVNAEVSVDELIPRLSRVIERSEKSTSSTDRNSSFNSSVSTRKQFESLRHSFTPATVRKSIQVTNPLRTSFSYSRTVCPPSALEDAPSADGPTGTSRLSSPKKQPKRKDSDQKPSWLTRTMTLKPEVKDDFRSAFECLSVAVETRRLATKFQQLTKCLREVSQQISRFCRRLKGFRGEKEAGCDELMDGLIILLSNLDESILSQLYIQIVMLIDLMPPFFKCNSFNFALVQFFIAFQFLKEQILLKRSRPDCDDVTSMGL